MYPIPIYYKKLLIKCLMICYLLLWLYLIDYYCCNKTNKLLSIPNIILIIYHTYNKILNI